MRVYIGYDPREQAAFDVACKTARGFGCDVIPLYEDRLRASGILTRPMDRRGQRWDFNSDAAMSTDFAISRFAVPIIAHSGWCLFADADVVFMQDPHVLEKYKDPSKAVMVVKHQVFELSATKMLGQKQQAYPRKLWSSVMLFNCDHPAHRLLNLTTLNQLPGRDLHAFRWLADEDIGDLPSEANWLVGMMPKPEKPIIAHLTLGGPWLEGWTPHEHDEIWTAESQR